MTTNNADDINTASTAVAAPLLQEQINALVANLDVELAVRQDALVKAAADSDIKKTIYLALPASLPSAPTSLVIRSGGGYTEDSSLEFALSSRTQIVALLNALPGVDLLMVQGGCSSFVPEERLAACSKGGEKVTEIGNVIYRVSSWLGEVREEYSWWTKLAGHLVKVVAATVKGGSTDVVVRGVTVPAAFNENQTSWRYANLPQGFITRWYGGSSSIAVPLTVHLPRGSSFEDSLAFSQGFEVKITAPHCVC